MIESLYPLCRSITGNGVRQTLAQVADFLPLTIHEVPSGTAVFDWTVPKEWNIRQAWIANKRGEKVVDFANHNLHILNYSVSVNKSVSRSELLRHVFSLPDMPDAIPYRTSYYNETWGFCVTHNQLLTLTDVEYDVFIDASLKPGSLTYGEYFHQGASSEEIIIYTHICHPSICNDNLTGIALLAHLANYLATQKTWYSYRFIFAPGTIGSITWLSRNQQNLDRVKYALVACLLGDDGKITYKETRGQNATLDRLIRTAFTAAGRDYRTERFSPYGYDERQFSAPGINVPTARITRSANGTYPEYHTSDDNLSFVKAENLADSYQAIVDVLNLIENNVVYVNTQPMCEPQLGRRGLYSKSGGKKRVGQRELALLWVLNLADGSHDLASIIERSQLSFAEIYNAVQELVECGLLTTSGVARHGERSAGE